MSEDWAAVYRTTFSDLVRYLYRKVWDADRAQDLAQEVFVRVLDQERRDGGRTYDNARAWLFTVAANLARDEARTAVRRRRHLTLLKSDPVVRPAPQPDPVERMTREEQQRTARAALETLSERDREVLLLWDAGLNYDEIAAQTGLAAGAIGTTLSRARRRLVEAHEKMEERRAARG